MQISTVSWEIDILIKIQKNELELKNTVIEMKNVFEGLISGLNKAEESISTLEVKVSRNFPNWNVKRKRIVFQKEQNSK